MRILSPNNLGVLNPKGSFNAAVHRCSADSWVWPILHRDLLDLSLQRLKNNSKSRGVTMRIALNIFKISRSLSPVTR